MFYDSNIVRCPPGTFHNATRNSCQNCKIGFYNDQAGRTSCTSCPLNYSTRKLQAKSINDCVGEIKALFRYFSVLFFDFSQSNVAPEQ